jgi:hypothetical protein
VGASPRKSLPEMEHRFEGVCHLRSSMHYMGTDARTASTQDRENPSVQSLESDGIDVAVLSRTRRGAQI